MNNRSYTKEVKLNQWGPGEWVDEPDEFEFMHHGFVCFGRRNGVWEGFQNEHLRLGHWCGYVLIPENHPWYAEDYEGIPNIDIHGGITHCGMDHIKLGFSIGFDCAHSGDLVPSFKRMYEEAGNPFIKNMMPYFEDSQLLNPEYKNLNFVMCECKSLAEQAEKAWKE